MDQRKEHVHSMEHDQHSSINSMILAIQTPTSLLFAEWCMSTLHGLVIAIILSAAIAICIEGFQEYRSVRILKAALREPAEGICGPDTIPVSCKLSCTVTYICQMVISYYLMLSVMTGNVWIFLAIITGSGIGYFLVRPTIRHFYLDNPRKSSKKTSNGNLVENKDALVEETPLWAGLKNSIAKPISMTLWSWLDELWLNFDELNEREKEKKKSQFLSCSILYCN